MFLAVVRVGGRGGGGGGYSSGCAAAAAVLVYTFWCSVFYFLATAQLLSLLVICVSGFGVVRWCLTLSFP